MELDKQPYDDFDVAVIRATQGDLPVVPEPYAPAAAELGITQAALLEHLAGMQERGLLRRVAAILFHRRAGFCANGMGVWKVPEDRILEIGPRMAAFRGISHCYQRPTYEDWPYQIFTMAHGRSKEECDAILDAIETEIGCIEDRATLYSSTEFKKVRLLYFTDDFKDWERAARRRVSRLAARHASRPSSTPGPLQYLPGGVNSPVRAMRAIGRDPIFVERAEGAELFDVDGNRYVDWIVLVGAADPRPRPPGRSSRRSSPRRRSGHDVRRADRRRGRPGRGGRAGGCRSVEMLRMTSSRHRGVDERDPPRPRGDRPREAPEVRRRLPRPRRRPARRGRQRPGDAGHPAPAPACPRRPPRRPSSCRGTTPTPSRAACAEHEFAAILAEPYPANMGLVLPDAGFLEHAARRRRPPTARC